jgi:hypothetical protein
VWGPFGLVADPDEYPVWQAIIELGRRGHSSEEIARRLQRLGVPTRHDRIWHASTVTNILRREDPTLAPSRYGGPLPNPDRRERMRRARQRRRTTPTGEPAGQVRTGA